LELLYSCFYSSAPALCCQTPLAPRTSLQKKLELEANSMFFLVHLKGYSRIWTFVLPQEVRENYLLFNAQLGLDGAFSGRCTMHASVVPLSIAHLRGVGSLRSSSSHLSFLLDYLNKISVYNYFLSVSVYNLKQQMTCAKEALIIILTKLFATIIFCITFNC
jgi:hypothetical protein